MSHCRFIFFEISNPSSGSLEEKLREDRKQLCSVAAVLHLPEDRAAERVVGEALLDLKDVQEQDNSFIEESFTDGRVYTSQECDSEVMTSPY